MSLPVLRSGYAWHKWLDARPALDWIEVALHDADGTYTGKLIRYWRRP